jgi:hypothetical protein
MNTCAICKRPTSHPSGICTRHVKNGSNGWADVPRLIESEVRHGRMSRRAADRALARLERSTDAT